MHTAHARDACTWPPGRGRQPAILCALFHVRGPEVRDRVLVAVRFRQEELEGVTAALDGLQVAQARARVVVDRALLRREGDAVQRVGREHERSHLLGSPLIDGEHRPSTEHPLLLFGEAAHVLHAPCDGVRMDANGDPADALLLQQRLRTRAGGEDASVGALIIAVGSHNTFHMKHAHAHAHDMHMKHETCTWGHTHLQVGDRARALDDFDGRGEGGGAGCARGIGRPTQDDIFDRC